jgi:hypothetical protein
MLNPNKMRGHEIVTFWILTITTIFGGLIYLAYLGIVYRMDRADPIVGPQIRAREAALEREAEERQKAFIRLVKNPLVWVPVALIVVIVSGNKPTVQPAQVTQAAASQEAAPIVSDGCDLAGAIPNCKAIMAELVAKGVKGTGKSMDATKPTAHASWQDKPIMSDAEWAAFQHEISQQNLERYEAEKDVDDARKQVEQIKRAIERDRFEGRAPLR